MQQANAYYSPMRTGSSSVFFADKTGQGRNLPGPRRRILRLFAIPIRLFALVFCGVCGSGSSLLRCRFADPGGVRVRSAFRELLESFLALVAEFHAAAAALCFRT